MFRIDDPTALASAPSAPAPTGDTPGFFTNGSPASGEAATIVPDWWLNQVQEELLGFLIAAGVAPAKGTNSQVLASSRKLFSALLCTPGAAPLFLPSGLIIQTFPSPKVQLGNANTAIEYAFNFPEPFPNACISIGAVDGGNACISWGSFLNITKTGGNGYVWSSAAGTPNAPAGAAITAIGY